MKTTHYFLAMVLMVSCATASQTPKTCPPAPDDSQEVAWRPYHHPYCGDVWITQGGSNPQMPSVGFPITDESVLLSNFDCIESEFEGDEGAPTNLHVDFETERLEKVNLGINGGIAWVRIIDDKLVVRVNESTYCGGITPELTATIIVVPKDAPPLEETNCRYGSPCTGSPRASL